MVRVSSPAKTQTMVQVNCQNGDEGGSWVGEILLQKYRDTGSHNWWYVCATFSQEEGILLCKSIAT